MRTRSQLRMMGIGLGSTRGPYRLTVGNVEIAALLDAVTLEDPQRLVGAHVTEFVSDYADQLTDDHMYRLPIIAFLVRSAGQLVMVDTGLGPRLRADWPRGRLESLLRDLGVEPGEVKLVVNTHLHVDHVGWNTVNGRDDKPVPFFTKATYLFEENEWSYWHQAEARLGLPDKARYLDECVYSIEPSRVSLVTSESVVLPNLRLIPTPGHTPGHVAVAVESAGSRAVIIGDVSHLTVQLEHPDWSTVWDVNPSQAEDTRRRLFDEAIASDSIIAAGHWPYPGIGRIVELGARRLFTSGYRLGRRYG